MNSMQEQDIPFYDFRGREPKTSLPALVTDWIKRKIGIVMNGAEDKPREFTLLIKKDLNEKPQAYTETSTHPDCKLEFTFKMK